MLDNHRLPKCHELFLQKSPTRSHKNGHIITVSHNTGNMNHIRDLENTRNLEIVQEIGIVPEIGTGQDIEIAR